MHKRQACAGHPNTYPSLPRPRGPRSRPLRSEGNKRVRRMERDDSNTPLNVSITLPRGRRSRFVQAREKERKNDGGGGDLHEGGDVVGSVRGESRMQGGPRVVASLLQLLQQQLLLLPHLDRTYQPSEIPSLYLLQQPLLLLPHLDRAYKPSDNRDRQQLRQNTRNHAQRSPACSISPALYLLGAKPRSRLGARSGYRSPSSGYRSPSSAQGHVIRGTLILITNTDIF